MFSYTFCLLHILFPTSFFVGFPMFPMVFGPSFFVGKKHWTHWFSVFSSNYMCFFYKFLGFFQPPCFFLNKLVVFFQVFMYGFISTSPMDPIGMFPEAILWPAMANQELVPWILWRNGRKWRWTALPWMRFHFRWTKMSAWQFCERALFGMVKWPFQRLSDLQLGDKKVTLNHLDDVFWFYFQQIFLLEGNNNEQLLLGQVNRVWEEWDVFLFARVFL